MASSSSARRAKKVYSVLKTYHDNPDEIQAGVDEAGRGCLMGPVCAAAVIWNPAFTDDPRCAYIQDSKTITEKRRKEMAAFIKEHAWAYGIAMLSAQEVDKLNILRASHKAMHMALDQCIAKYPQKSLDRILVDGNSFQPFLSRDGEFVPHTSVVSGDSTYLSIAAASILAKTTRDEWVADTCAKHPEYEDYKWASNKGYGTRDHMKAIQEKGYTPYHRLTFGKHKQDDTTSEAC